MSVVPVTRGHHYVVSAGHELATLAAFEAEPPMFRGAAAGKAKALRRSLRRHRKVVWRRPRVGPRDEESQGRDSE